MELDLEKIRSAINDVDSKIVELYETRLALCDEVAEFKRRTGKAVLDRAREEQLLSRLSQIASPENRSAVTGLYKRILEISRSRQSAKITEPSRVIASLTEKCGENAVFPGFADVACQGVEGAYSDIAAHILFEEPRTMFFEDFESVIKSVDSGLCKYGVLPFENSIYGSVSEVYEMLSRFGGFVVRSVKLPVHHVLMAKDGVDFSEIREIHSHRQAIGQCSIFLGKNKNIKVIPCENTAKAAKYAAQSERRDIAAICSPVCAEKYGLSVLRGDVQNSNVNFTMFYCISKELEVYPEVTKFAFMFGLENRAGALADVLSRFSAAGINLTKIESRPIPGRDFEFMFYVEGDTQGITKELTELFTVLENESEFFKFMGAYTEISAE
ncbi:MAG: chorismate mutase [Clostridia bacterium]|nr:chorismate mutase [Clostridia bacterium]